MDRKNSAIAAAFVPGAGSATVTQRLTPPMPSKVVELPAGLMDVCLRSAPRRVDHQHGGTSQKDAGRPSHLSRASPAKPVVLPNHDGPTTIEDVMSFLRENGKRRARAVARAQHAVGASCLTGS